MATPSKLLAWLGIGLALSSPAVGECLTRAEQGARPPTPVGHIYGPHRATQRRLEEIAKFWAPVISQDTDDSDTRADYISAFDYDLDMSAANNWNNLNSYQLDSYVYSWVIQSPDRYYVGYAIFHPRDWTDRLAGGPDALGDQHVNDLEGALLSIRRDDTLPGGGRFEGLVTEAHGAKFGFADDDTPASWDGFDSVRLSRGIGGEDEDLDFVHDDAGVHPVLYMQSKGHGLYAHPLNPANALHRIVDWNPLFIGQRITDWRGKDFSGLPSPTQIAGVSSEDIEDWDDGITYHYEGIAEAIVPGTQTANLPRDWRIVGYDLLSIRQLWDCRADSRVFRPGSGEFQPGHANAPWGWNQWFFWNPARQMVDQLDYPDGQEPVECAIEATTFGELPKDCVPAL